MNGPRYGLLFLGFLFGLPAFFIKFGLWTDYLFWEHFFDFSHVPLFAGATLWLAACNPLGLVSTWQRRCFAIAAAVISAAAVELIQPATGRSASWVDFFNGLCGIAIAGLILFFRQRHFWRLVAGASVLTAIPAIPLLMEWRGLLWRDFHFPLLADFEDDTQLVLWDNWRTGRRPWTEWHRSSEHASEGRYSLRLETEVGDFPGLGVNLGAQDWRGWKTFRCDIFNPTSQKMTLGMRISDTGWWVPHSSRFNAEVPLLPGWNHVSFPIESILQTEERRMNPSHMAEIVFFFDHPKEPHVFFLDHLRLER